LFNFFLSHLICCAYWQSTVNMMPLFHVGGIVRNLWAPMLSGGSAIMCAGFDAIAFWSLAELFKATWYVIPPCDTFDPEFLT
jgi:acyl-CoA synthetase (AMP-forming)/AMP-acid ligase II